MTLFLFLRKTAQPFQETQASDPPPPITSLWTKRPHSALSFRVGARAVFSTSGYFAKFPHIPWVELPCPFEPRGGVQGLSLLPGGSMVSSGGVPLPTES